LLRRQRAVAANGDEALRRRAATAFGAVADNERLGAALLDAQAKPRQKTVSKVVAIAPKLGRIHDPFGQKNAHSLGHVSTPTHCLDDPNLRIFGQHRDRKSWA
jgi:hypothetical protein